MGVNELITNIGLEFAIELELNEDGVASLIINDNFEVEFEYVESVDTLFISSALPPLEGKGNEGVYKALLDANLYGQKTGGAVFGRDERTQEIILFFKVEAGKVTYGEFKEAMTQYLDVRDQWTTTFDGLVNTQDTPSDPTTELNFNHALRV